MAQERPSSEPRELKFGGEGKAESIRGGFAITTLRNPRLTYNFPQGQEIIADCFDDNEKVKIVVIANEIKKLKDFSVPQRALDGFSSVKEAIEVLRTYPGYENTNRDSLIQAITFVKKESYDALPKRVRDSISGKTFDELIKNPELEHLFFSPIVGENE